MKMAEIIRIVESTDWSPERCAQLAAFYHNAIYDDSEQGGGPVAAFDWHFEPAFHVNVAIDGMSPQERASWMQDEIEADDEEDGLRGYRVMVGQEIEDPVVLTLDRGQVFCWDGNHRIGACCLGGVSTLPAVVGVARKG